MTTDKPNIYRQHDAAFSAVSAFVVMKGAERVATVAFKFPRDGAMRLYCYFHIVGTQMSRGWAGGGGYDKKSAACREAVDKVAHPAAGDHGEAYPVLAANCIEIKAALKGDSGRDWNRRLEDAGFQVWQAI